MNRLLAALFRRIVLPLVLPLALLLAQHSGWAHSFAHDSAKIAAHGQSQDHATHDCCLPFQTAGDLACGTPTQSASASGGLTSGCAPASSRPAQTLLPYCSRAPPASS